MDSRNNNRLFVFSRSWIICLLVATGITGLSFCSVHIALVVMHLVAVLLGLPSTDDLVHFSI